MVGFKDKLLFSHNKKELTKDLPYFDKVKVRYMYCYWTACDLPSELAWLL